MRILFKLIIFIVIVGIASLLALPFIVDPNDYKQEISSQVEKVTGRQLTLDGDINLSVFPWVALELGPLSLSNAAGFKADSFAKVNAAEIRIKLMPLLKKQLEMDTVILDGLVLNLEKNKAGKTNWDDFTSKNDKSTASTKKSDNQSNDAEATPALAAISIAGVKLSNANILWSDATTAEHYQLHNFNLNTDPLVPGEPTALDMNFDLISDKPQAKAHITLDTNVMVDAENQHYMLTDLNLTTQASGKDLPFSQTELTFSGDINADMVKQLLTIDDLTLAAKANKDTQSIDAKLSAQVSSNLANQQTTIKGFVLSADVIDPSLPTGKATLDLSADISADMKQQTMTLSALVINAYDLIINGDIKTTKLLSDNPNFVGSIAVKPFNLRQLANHLSIELPVMADDSTLELVQISTELEGSSKHINAKQLQLTLDQSKLSGRLAINNFAKPAFNFKLALDEIDADRYLPPVSKNESPKIASPATAAAAGAKELPLDTLRQINAKGVLDIGKLKISGTHSEKIHIEINAAKGNIKLSPLSANMYQGQYQGNIALDARGKTLKMSLNEKLQGVKASPLLKDLTGDDKISGTVNAKATLSGNGITVDQIKQTLSGNGNFSFTDGAVKGVNVAESIRKAKAALKGEKLPASDAAVQTDFSKLSGSFTATNGIISNKDLLAMSPLLRINGAGKIDLPKEGINYGLKVSIVETSSGQGGKALEDLKGLTIPVKITGTFSNPKPAVDLASMLKERATAEAKAKIADKLKDKLGGDLGGLLGGALAPKSPAPVAPKDPAAKPAPEPEPAKTPEDQLKDALSDKLKGFF